MREIYLKIKVIPSSSRTEEKEPMSDGTLKIALRAAPEKNKANLELVDFLSKKYYCPKDRIKIISGHTSRLKLVKIAYEEK